MDRKKIRSRLIRAWDADAEALAKLALEIHRHPELSFQEFNTAALLVDFLASRGFKIKKKLAGLETSFHARSYQSTGKPAVGFLAEMDALAGLGHACGHNLIAASSVAAAVILRRAFPELKGSIEVIGCPAEERGGGKVILNNAGIFNHLDFAILVHPSDRTEIFKLSLALVEVDLEFIGKSSHAAAAPEKGINALDAAIATFNAVNALRSRLGGYARINGIITEGGKAPNIIPGRAAAEFWVRDDRLSRALEYVDLVIQAGEGAAKSIGTKLKAKAAKKLAYAPFQPNRTAGKFLREIFEEIGLKIEQGDEKAEMGSTDFGNVSWRVPSLHPTIAISRAPVHSTQFAEAAGGAAGINMVKKAGLAMAMLGYRIMTDARLRAEMKSEHKRSQLSQ